MKKSITANYGSYGHSMDAHFHQQDYHYWQRFVYAIAHIRGGEDLEENGMKTENY
jgi:protease II